MAETLRRGFDKDSVDRALRVLCDYAVEHFADEEALMDPEAYPQYDQHLSEHMQCTTKALDFLEAFSGGREVDMDEFLNFVIQWIRDHITSMDMTLGAFLKQRG